MPLQAGELLLCTRTSWLDESWHSSKPIRFVATRTVMKRKALKLPMSLPPKLAWSKLEECSSFLHQEKKTVLRWLMFCLLMWKWPALEITLPLLHHPLLSLRLELTSCVLPQRPLGPSRAVGNSCFQLFFFFCLQKRREVLVMEPA